MAGKKPKDPQEINKEKANKEKLKKLKESLLQKKPKIRKYTSLEKEIIKLEFLSTRRSVIPRGARVTKLSLTLNDGSTIDLLEPIQQ